MILPQYRKRWRDACAELRRTIASSAKPAAKFVIGQRHQGGIIVFVTKDGAHGLIMADKDLGGFDWDSAKRKAMALKQLTNMIGVFPRKRNSKKCMQPVSRPGLLQEACTGAQPKLAMACIGV